MERLKLQGRDALRLAAAACAAASGAAHAGWLATNLGTLGGYSTQPCKTSDLGSLGGSFLCVAALNDAGNVAGSGNAAGDPARHAFVSNGATLIDVGESGGHYSAAVDINAARVVAGSAHLAGDQARCACPYANGGMRDPSMLGGSSRAYRIDASAPATQAPA